MRWGRTCPPGWPDRRSHHQDREPLSRGSPPRSPSRLRPTNATQLPSHVEGQDGPAWPVPTAELEGDRGANTAPPPLLFPVTTRARCSLVADDRVVPSEDGHGHQSGWCAAVRYRCHVCRDGSTGLPGHVQWVSGSGGRRRRLPDRRELRAPRTGREHRVIADRQQRPNGPLTIPLSGTGGSLPQGPPGAVGAAGPTGATGATGARGPAGKIELVVCTTVTKKTTKNGRKVAVKTKKCSARLVSGPVKFTIDKEVGASVSRGHVVYATGKAVATGPDHWTVVLQGNRRLRPGQYTLTLHARHDSRWLTYRRAITIT